MVGSDAMLASTQTRDDAQYDNPLRGALLCADCPSAAAIRTVGDEIVRYGGPAGRPGHGAWAVPAVSASSRIPRHFPRGLDGVRILRYSRPATPSLPLSRPATERTACDEGGQ